MLKKLIKRILLPNTYSNEAFISYLRNKGVEIGEGCIFWAPNHTYIDLQRVHMLKIGNYVKVTSGVHILTHDYSRSVLCNMSEYGNVGEADDTYIGDNVFIGVGSIILMGTHIGNNSIVGAGSVTAGIFPDNVVIAGNPARIICTIDEFYNRRKAIEIDAAKKYVQNWRVKYGSDPQVEDLDNSFAWLYLTHDEETYNKYRKMLKSSGVNMDIYKDIFLKNKPVYPSFNDFLNDC